MLPLSLYSILLYGAWVCFARWLRCRGPRHHRVRVHFWRQVQQKLYDELESKQPRGHGLGFSSGGDGEAAAVPAPGSSDGGGVASPGGGGGGGGDAAPAVGGDSAEEAMAKARAIAIKLGLATGTLNAGGGGGDGVKRKFADAVRGCRMPWRPVCVLVRLEYRCLCHAGLVILHCPRESWRPPPQ